MPPCKFDPSNGKHMLLLQVGVVAGAITCTIAVYFLFIDEETKITGKKEEEEKSLDFFDRPPEDYQEFGLDRLNDMRSWHDAPPLELDPELMKKARACAYEYAKHGTVSRGCDFQYNKDGSKSGQLKSMSMNPPCKPDPKSMEGPNAGDDELLRNSLDGWYMDSTKYDYSNPDPKPKNYADVAYFTEMVWKNTKKVGFGVARNRKLFAVVAMLEPNGNKKGEYGANVGKSHLKDIMKVTKDDIYRPPTTETSAETQSTA